LGITLALMAILAVLNCAIFLGLALAVGLTLWLVPTARTPLDVGPAAGPASKRD
jgi:hypothetical protein